MSGGKLLVKQGRINNLNFSFWLGYNNQRGESIKIYEKI